MMKWKVTRNSRSSSADRSLGYLLEVGINNIEPRPAFLDTNKGNLQRKDGNAAQNRKQQQGVKQRLSRKDSFAASDCIPLNLKDILGITRQRTETVLTDSQTVLLDRRRSRSEVRFSSTDRLTVAYHAYPVSVTPQQHPSRSEFRQQKPTQTAKDRCPSPPTKSGGWLRGRKRERANKKTSSSGVCQGVGKNGNSDKTPNESKKDNPKTNGHGNKALNFKNHTNGAKNGVEVGKGPKNIQPTVENKNETNLTFPCLDVRHPGKVNDGVSPSNPCVPIANGCKETGRFKRQKGYAPRPETRNSVQGKEQQSNDVKKSQPSQGDAKKTSPPITSIPEIADSFEKTPTTYLNNEDIAISSGSPPKSGSGKIFPHNEEQHPEHEEHTMTVEAVVHQESDSNIGNNDCYENKVKDNNCDESQETKGEEISHTESELLGTSGSYENGEELNSMDTELSELPYDEENASEAGSHPKESRKSPIQNPPQSAEIEKGGKTPSGEVVKKKRTPSEFENKATEDQQEDRINKTSFAKMSSKDCGDHVICNPTSLTNGDSNRAEWANVKHARTKSKSSKDGAVMKSKNKISIQVTDKENIGGLSEQGTFKSSDEEAWNDKILTKEATHAEPNPLESEEHQYDDISSVLEKKRGSGVTQDPVRKLRPKGIPPPPPRDKMTSRQEMTVSVVIRNPPLEEGDSDQALVNSEMSDCTAETLVLKKSFVLTIAKQEMGFRSMCAGKDISYEIESCKKKEHQISVSFLCSGAAKKPLLERQMSMSPVADMRLRSISMPPFNRNQNGELVPVPAVRGGTRESRSRDRQNTKKRRKKDSGFHMPKAVIDELSQVLEKRKRSPGNDSD